MKPYVTKRVIHTFIINDWISNSDYEQALECMKKINYVFNLLNVQRSSDDVSANIYPIAKRFRTADLIEYFNLEYEASRRVFDCNMLEDPYAEIELDYIDFKNGVFSFIETTSIGERGNFDFCYLLIDTISGKHPNSMFHHIYRVEDITMVDCNDNYSSIYYKYNMTLKLYYIDSRLDKLIAYNKNFGNPESESVIVKINARSSDEFISTIKNKITSIYTGEDIKGLIKYIENAVYGYDVLFKPLYRKDPTINAYELNEMSYEEI